MARRLKYVILAALIGSLGLGLGYSLLRAHLLKRPELLLEEAARRVDLSLNDIDYTQISAGRKQWTLKAKQVRFEQANETFTLKEILVTVYRPSGQELEIQGDVGLYNRKEAWIKVQGRARLSSDTGFRLTSESFLYRLEEQELSSPDPVALSGPGLEITGRGIRVDVANWKAVFLEDVTSRWQSPENKGV